MNADQVAEINACGRYLTVGVLRNASGDFTNKGVSSEHEYLYIPHPNGPINHEDISDPMRILELLPPAFDGCPLRVRPNYLARRSMCGGNFVYSSDSRFVKLYGAPLSVHDRVEW